MSCLGVAAAGFTVGGRLQELHAQVAGLEREMEKRTEEFEKRLSALLQESMEEKQRLWRSEMERRHEERSAETKKLMQQMHDMSMQQVCDVARRTPFYFFCLLNRKEGRDELVCS